MTVACCLIPGGGLYSESQPEGYDVARSAQRYAATVWKICSNLPPPVAWRS
jgi:hypothetical protein